jgi:hypothetical protein
MNLRWKAPSANKKVAAFAHVVHFGERGTEAAPATSERYGKSAGAYVTKRGEQEKKGVS